jgi:GNAT superfamily N-acetyltransferase
MHRVRMAVRENRLISTAISEADYVAAIEATGRGWVIELNGNVVAFGVANSDNGSIWALFVQPGYEGQGYGRRLHDTMMEWLWQQGHEKLWLNTESGTRAQRFYESAGWKRIGNTDSGEVRYEIANPSQHLI